MKSHVLKRFLCTAMAVVLCFGAVAISGVTPVRAEELTTTFDSTAQGYSNSQAFTSIKIDKITFSADGGSTASAYYNTGTAIRIYGGGTFTVTAEEGYKITKITITNGSGSGKSLDGTGDNAITIDKEATIEENSVVTLTEPAQEVVFTAGGSSGHWRMKICEVTYEKVTIPEVIDDDILKVSSHSLELDAVLHIRHYLALGENVTISADTACGTEWWSVKPGEDPANPTTEGTFIDGFLQSTAGNEYYVTSGDIVAKDINTVQYFRVWIIVDGTKYYTPVQEYSVAQYLKSVCNTYDAETDTWTPRENMDAEIGNYGYTYNELKATVEALIAYGDAASAMFK